MKAKVIEDGIESRIEEKTEPGAKFLGERREEQWRSEDHYSE